MSRRQPSWPKSPVFWGAFSFSSGLIIAVLATIFRDIRFLLWVALPGLLIGAWVVIGDLVRKTWTRRSAFGAVCVMLAAVTEWLYTYVPPEVPMAMEATHTSDMLRLHDRFTPGACRAGIPEVSQRIQWTWLLAGARFGCVSNEYKSRATIDFEPGVYETVSTHIEVPFIPIPTKTVRVRIEWFGQRTDGKVKWVLSTACMGHDAQLNFTFRDALTLLDSPEEDTAKSSEGTLQLDPQCTWPDGVLIRLARRGNDKDDTMPATAHVTGLSLDSDSENSKLGPGN